MNKHVLIVSPIPSHPQIQGNSTRIFRLGRMWQLLGYRVHFLYFGLEGLTRKDEKDMRRCWDFFYYLAPVGVNSEPKNGDFFEIDEWYDDRVSQLAEKLCQQWDFYACMVNYVWFSKALNVVPPGTLRIIDTHDIFGDRHHKAQTVGIAPSWFYTTTEEEKKALDRADLVVAIQDEEKRYFDKLTGVRVEVIGCVLPPNYLPTRAQAGAGRIRVGFIGSANPFNVNSIRRLQGALAMQAGELTQFEFHLAGSICRVLEQGDSVFVFHGMVDEVSDFLRDIDVVINPMVGGTGLKIKSIEAISFGKPLLATQDAMVGIASREAAHCCDSVESLVTQLAALDWAKVGALGRSSVEIHRRYNEIQIEVFEDLFGGASHFG